MIGQFKKYWEMLFAKPVEAHLSNGEIMRVYPQRTSNVMERMFREFQRSEYKRTGMGTLGRTVRAMISETPMMKNLESPEYMKIILNGQPTLAARFAQLDSKRVQREWLRKGHGIMRSCLLGYEKLYETLIFMALSRRRQS